MGAIPTSSLIEETCASVTRLCPTLPKPSSSSSSSPTFLLTARYLSQEPAGSHARCKLEGISLSRHFLLPNYFRQVCGCCLTPLLADRMRIDPKCCAYDVAFHERPPDLVFVRQRAELLKSPLGR